MYKSFRYLVLSVLSFSGVAIASSLLVSSPLETYFVTPAEAQGIVSTELTEEDQFCKSKLFNSLSQETCAAACPGGAGDCVKVQSYKKEFNPELEEDLDCYACSSAYSCYDMGFIYDPWDCIGCEMNPDKMCVNAVGGGFGFPGITLPKDSDGFQCWDCVDRPDTCWKHFPGSAVKSACDTVCAGKPDHQCVKVGVNPDDGRDCFTCQKIPPPPVTCHDIGLIYQNECNQCPPNRPKCEQAVGVGFFFPVGQVIKDENGKTCFECMPKPKTCEEQGLPSKCAADEICDPMSAPNGANCCSCRKKARTCSDYLYDDPPCDCKEGEFPITAHLDDGTGAGTKIECCECAKDACYPELSAMRCLDECLNKGGKCEPITRERGAPPCYRCVWPQDEQDPKTCNDIYMHDSCSPNPCSQGEDCKMTEVTLDGKKIKCGECIPKDVDPTACENHTNPNYPYHRFVNCAPCYQANMACDEKQVSTNPPLTCAKCLDPIDTRCEPPLLPGQCFGSSTCSEGEVCESAGNNCHTCRKKKTCEDMNLPYTCLSSEYCTSVIAENGDECCQCTPKNCTQVGKQPASVCNSCDGDCKNDGKAPNGEQCKKCEPKAPPPPPKCDDGLFEGPCPGSCSGDEECASAGNACHTCVKKEIEEPNNCAAIPGSTEDPACGGQCPQSQCKCQKVFAPQSTTTQSGTQYNYEFNCCKCEELPPPPSCDLEKGEFSGACPQECSGDKECQSIQGKACHKCVQKKKECGEINPDLFYQSDCGVCEGFGGGECNPTIQDDWGVRCFECIFEDQWKACIEKGWNTGLCPGNCKVGQTCTPHSIPIKDPVIQAWQCHECITEEKYCQEEGYTNSCPAGQECVKVKTKDGLTCCDCKSNTPPPPPPLPCPSGTQHGMCIPGVMDPCKPEGACVDRSTEGADCYSCRPMTGTGEEPIGFIPGNDFQPIKFCKEPAFSFMQCGDCYEQGGECVPSDAYGNPLEGDGEGSARRDPYDIDGVSGATKLGSILSPICYTCVPKNSCEALGFVCSCMDCYEDELCLPAQTIKNPQTGEPFICKRCVPKSHITSIEVTWIIIIIETPHGRVILKEGDAPGFEPSSVMALAQAEKIDANTFMTASGLLSGLPTAGSISDIANLLQQGAGSKRKLSDDCFDNLSAAEPVREEPSGVRDDNKKKKKGKEALSTMKDVKYGKDPANDYKVDGPVVSCGQVDGKDAMIVFDSIGNPVKTILKEELKDNPNALLQALQKAAELSQQAQNVSGKIAQLQSLNAKTVAQGLGKMLLNKASQLGKDEDVEPDDMFFHYTEKKKKKLFGILGSSKPIKSALGGNDLFATAKESAGEVEVKDQWGLKAIGFLPRNEEASAWNIIDGSQKNVIVAVIDSGLDTAHEDAPQYVWKNDNEIPGNGKDDDGNGYIDDVNGWNFLSDNNDLIDYNGHGTFVAGIIAAKRNNEVGIAGINPGAVIMPLKVVDSEGQTNSLRIYRAINYAVIHGAKVINVSLGGRSISDLEQAALNFAAENGVFVVVASGNTGEFMGDVGPASANNAFTVGAIDMDMLRSTISSEGPNNAIMAPGESIFSLRSKDSFHKRAIKDELHKLYFTQSGTSFSTPMVAATVSLMLAKNPDLTPKDIEDILVGTATDMDDPGWDGKTGAGLLNATQALKRADEKFLNIKIVRFVPNKNDKKKLESVDVYATVRGSGLKEFTVGIDKGKNGKKFETIAGPVTQPADQDWVARISEDDLRGSREWTVQISAIDRNGQEYTATTLLDLTLFK